ncbi:MAG: hypothetical protein RLZZ164_822 [Actinomycetota bacterium]|jgi:hypothetical protein
MTVNTAPELFGKVLKLGALLVGGVAVVVGLIGLLAASVAGLVSALIGAAMALVFVSMTALSVRIGSKLSLGGFFGVVLGGWLVKLIGFIVLVLALKGATFIVGWVLFVSIVAAVIGSLILDSVLVLRSRIPTIQS